MSFIQDGLTVEQMIGITTGPLTEREKLIRIYRQFYAGEQKIKLEKRQEKYLIIDQGVPKAITNMCKLIVNKIKNRTKILREGKGIRAADDDSAKFADFATKQWQETNLDMQQSELMTYVLRDGEAALFVEWTGEQTVYNAKPVYDGTFYDGEGGVRFHMLDPRNDVVSFASYRWEVPVYDADGNSETSYIRLNVYVPGEDGSPALTYRYQSAEGGDDWIPLTDEQIASEVGASLSNPERLETPHIIPQRFSDTDNESVIKDILNLEQLRNKSILDVDTAADLHGLPTMVADDFEAEIDPETKQPKPKLITPGYWMQALNAKRIEGADLELMWKGTLKPYLMEMGILKNFPVWVLNPQDNTVPSGTALKVQERDFVAMIQDKQDKLTVQWQDVFSIARKHANLTPDTNYPEDSRLSFIWVNPATENVIEDRKIEVETAKAAKQSEETIWRDIYGYTDEQVIKERERQQKDLDTKQQQATIIETLVNSTFNADGAITVAGLSDDDNLALRMVGSVDTQEDTQEVENDDS